MKRVPRSVSREEEYWRPAVCYQEAVKPAPFRYERPREVDEVLSLLASHGADAKILAGGQSLVPLLNMRLARPAVVIDINRVTALETIHQQNGRLILGALARDRDVELSAAVRQHCPVLTEALRHVGHVEIRHRGTVCGSLAHADPAAELPVVALALDAELLARSARGTRTIAAARFFVSTLTTALAEDELLAEARVPVLAPDVGWGFVELARRQGDFAIAAVAALLERDADGRCARARVVLGGVDVTPIRAEAAEQVLVGEPLTEKRFGDAAHAAVERLGPPSDVHASSAYRKKVAAVLVERALRTAARRSSRAPM